MKNMCVTKVVTEKVKFEWRREKKKRKEKNKKFVIHHHDIVI